MECGGKRGKRSATPLFLALPANFRAGIRGKAASRFACRRTPCRTAVVNCALTRDADESWGELGAVTKLVAARAARVPPRSAALAARSGAPAPSANLHHG